MTKQAFPNNATVTYATEDANHTCSVMGYDKGWYTVALLDDPETVYKARAKDLALYEIPEDEEEPEAIPTDELIEQGYGSDAVAPSPEEDEEPANRSMAKQLAAARARYTKSTSASGKSSMHNGDQLALLLAGAEPLEAMELAHRVTQQTDDEAIDPTVRYAHLNPGQQRMNAGNLIRARVKKELITVDEVAEIFAKI